MTSGDCLIIIPAFNEDQSIGEVLRSIRETGVAADIVVVNDGSTDSTETAVRTSGETVISLPYNLGYGGALQTGFKYAVAQGYQYIVQFDADGQHDPLDILTILDHLRAGGVDIVIGSRFLGRGACHLGVAKKAVISLFRLLIKVSTGIRVSDPTSGLQGLTHNTFAYYAVMGHYPEDFPDADTLIDMILSGFRVREVPANIRLRQAGKSMHMGLRTIYYLLKMLMSILVVVLRKKTVKEGTV